MRGGDSDLLGLSLDGRTDKQAAKKREARSEGGDCLGLDFLSHERETLLLSSLSLSLSRQFRVSSRHSLLSGAQYVAAANELR